MALVVLTKLTFQQSRELLPLGIGDSYRSYGGVSCRFEKGSRDKTILMGYSSRLRHLRRFVLFYCCNFHPTTSLWGKYAPQHLPWRYSTVPCLLCNYQNREYVHPP